MQNVTAAVVQTRDGAGKRKQCGGDDVRARLLGTAPSLKLSFIISPKLMINESLLPP